MQAKRFASGEAEICIATDAVGMGLNLPADNVCFVTATKYDGFIERRLTPAEVQQIGGRAGRFGLSDQGTVGALERTNLRIIRKLFHAEPPLPSRAFTAPSVEDIASLRGVLWQRLERWSNTSLKPPFECAPFVSQVELAKRLSTTEVEHLGMELSLCVIQAPVRQPERIVGYWHACVQAVCRHRSMPLPTAPPELKVVANSTSLADMENGVHEASVYNWLAARRELEPYGQERDTVGMWNMVWAEMIDHRLSQVARTRQQRKQNRKRKQRLPKW